MINHLTGFIKSVYQNYFEIASCLGASGIILLAILMDSILDLEACPMCIMTRYVFGMIAVISLIGVATKKLFILNKLLIALSSATGLALTGKQIYLQNLSVEQIANLPMGCGMPLGIQIEYFGFFGGIANAYKGGPTCAEVNWEFIFNFAEWGFIFFLVYFVGSISKIFRQRNH
jgi:disulfide bond formation protein DsbB